MILHQFEVISPVAWSYEMSVANFNNLWLVSRLLITGDESCVYGYDPETSGFPRHKKARQSKSNAKVILIVLFDSYGSIRSGKPMRTTVNLDHYKIRDQKKCSMASSFIMTMCRVRPPFSIVSFWLKNIFLSVTFALLSGFITMRLLSLSKINNHSKRETFYRHSRHWESHDRAAEGSFLKGMFPGNASSEGLRLG